MSSFVGSVTVQPVWEDVLPLINVNYSIDNNSWESLAQRLQFEKLEVKYHIFVKQGYA